MKLTKSEREWQAHCERMQALYEAKAAELQEAGWVRAGIGIGEHFTRNGERIALRRQLGSEVWYTIKIHRGVSL